MTRIVAGVDVGNTTTEVVLADASQRPPRPLAWDRAPTRGRKGSLPAVEAAAALVRRLAVRAQLHLDEAVLAPQQPVDTLVEVVPRPMPPTGWLRVVATGSSTPGRAGSGAGRPALLTPASPPPSGPVVALVPAGTGYAEAVRRLQVWLARGVDVRAVLVHDDEGVLIARRVALAGPVLDRVDVGAVVRAVRLAVEVCAPGSPSIALADPLRLVVMLELADADRAHAAVVAREVSDAPNAVVAVFDDRWAGSPPPQAAPGIGEDLDDVWSVDLDALASQVEMRRDPGHRLGTAFAALRAQAPAGSAELAARLAAVLGVPARTAASEAAAARAGALSTAGVAPDALVLDLGGGTLDAVAASGEQSIVAGGGELVAACVATLLQLPRGAAEWVKRGPCGRLDGPHVLLGEDGTRTFLEQPAPGTATGALVVPGPAGWLPFSRSLSPAEWRAARLRLKRKALGENVSRAIAGLTDVPEAAAGSSHVVLVGGVAGDAELLRSLTSELDAALPGALVGRADVAGVLGHRWAVAYGLTLPPTW